LARLGIQTGFLGKVGNDREGQLLLNDFKRENVNTKGVAAEANGMTGVVIGFIDLNGERALYVAPGVNDQISFEDIKLEYFKSLRLIHLTSFVGDSPFKSQIRLAQQLPRHIKISLDPGMLYAKRGLEQLKPLLKHVSVFLPNEAELRILTGLGCEDGSQELLSQGVEIVAVKRGTLGCFITDGKVKYVIKSLTVRAIDTTGAGDAWNAGFLYGLLGNKNLLECGQLANFVASRCVVKMGARTGLPSVADLPKL
jgi:ribokinase